MLPTASVDYVLLRSASDAAEAIPSTLRAAAEVDPRLSSLAIAHSLDDALWAQRLPSTIATIFAAVVGGMALLLSSVGIYGTIANAVAQRTREIGIRMALGGQHSAIMRLVLTRTMALVGVGAASAWH